MERQELSASTPYGGFRGQIRYGLVRKGLDKPEITTVSNRILYAGADILAKMMGGDDNYRPKYIGFLFGAQSSPLFNDVPDRGQTWQDIATELNGTNCNILVVPVVNTYSYGVDASYAADAAYQHNLVTITAVSDSSGGEYAFSGAAYKSVMEDNDTVYHALLLAKYRGPSGSQVYMPFSRASLKKSGTYPRVMPGWALSLMWDIIFY
jgi:hypothetical protein